MKKLKQIIAQVKTFTADPSDEQDKMLWQLICYAPKMPVRLQQEQLLNEAANFSLSVKDEHFAKKDLIFNGFKWGNGKHKVLITHGWGSKAADFAEMITALKENPDLKIIAFDAPGNGSSEGELSNLMLYVLAIKAIVHHFGEPDIVIGHSLGVMANVIAMKEMNIIPSLLISLAPLVRLKENFEASMNLVGVLPIAQNSFFKRFEERFHVEASSFKLNNWYADDGQQDHWLAYDQNDQTAPFAYLQEFLIIHPSIQHQSYDGVGHEKILKSPQVIHDLVEAVNKAFTYLMKK